MSEGLTTHEDLKDIYLPVQGSPYNRFSYFANLSRYYCRRLSKRLLDMRLLYTPVKIIELEMENEKKAKETKEPKKEAQKNNVNGTQTPENQKDSADNQNGQSI